MTAQNIYQNALAITGYPYSELTDLSEAQTLAVNFVNIAYADLYYTRNDTGFSPITSITDTVDLPENMLNDCISYYVASLIANLLGCEDDFSVFSEVYLKKKQKFIKHSEKDSIVDCLPKGCYC
ncbi:MAG: hypothetical protein IJO19_00965 [Clostridia bacterium]|nr:hypothetical protein [Clostridia bacterium]